MCVYLKNKGSVVLSTHFYIGNGINAIMGNIGIYIRSTMHQAGTNTLSV